MDWERMVFEAGRAVQFGFDRQGDQLLDFLGRQTRRFGLEDHLRRGKFGEDVEPRPRSDVEAIGNDYHSQREDHRPVAQGKLDDAVEHKGRRREVNRPR